MCERHAAVAIDISPEPNVEYATEGQAYFVQVAIPFIVLATDMMDAYRQVRDIWEQELIGTAAEDWPFEITVQEEQE